MSSLKSSIERLASLGEVEHDPDARRTFLEFRDQLTHGKIRAAEKLRGDKDARWTVNAWVKQGILLGFRLGELSDMSAGLSFVDKDTFPARQFTVADRVRVVPGGSSVRTGAYVAAAVICMPPMFINVGAYVDEGTMIDSHALVGSCAQIGKRVHLSAAAQIGGVLEPINAAPVIIEDDVLVGGNCGVYEGTLVRARAVLGAGTILTRSTPLYDLVRGEVYRATADAPLEVPENAVVVPGSRAVTKRAAAEMESFALYSRHREVPRRKDRPRHRVRRLAAIERQYLNSESPATARVVTPVTCCRLHTVLPSLWGVPCFAKCVLLFSSPFSLYSFFASRAKRHKWIRVGAFRPQGSTSKWGRIAPCSCWMILRKNFMTQPGPWIMPTSRPSKNQIVASSPREKNRNGGMSALWGGEMRPRELRFGPLFDLSRQGQLPGEWILSAVRLEIYRRSQRETDPARMPWNRPAAAKPIRVL